MGLLRRILGLIRRPSIEPEKREENYRCIRCSAEFERNHRVCPDCGTQYIVPLHEEEQ
jgi:rRNA maturation endonuclease Nob1